MNKQFFDKNENEDYSQLEEFNSLLKLKELGRTPTKTKYDASGYTNLNKYAVIELKQRNQIILEDKIISGCSYYGNPYTGETIMIEQHKWCSMIEEAKEKDGVPLYINFLKNAIIVFNLHKIKDKEEKVYKNIISKGYRRLESGERFMLKLQDAFIYQKENNEYKLISRPNEAN